MIKKKLSFIFLICFLFSWTTKPIILSVGTRNVVLAVFCVSAAIIPSYYALKSLGFLRNIAGYSGKTFSRHDVSAFGRDASQAAGLFRRAWAYIAR